MTWSPTQAVRRLLSLGALVLAACSSQSDGEATQPSASTAVSSVPESSVPAPVETSDPTVISRRTEGPDVLVLPDDVELPPDYTQAAVPVDAFPATQLTISAVIAGDPAPPSFNPVNVEPTEAFDPIVDISVDIRACRLVAVWVLPHPDEIVVGYEEYPELTCAVPLMHTVEFEVPRAGKNSEGEWNYSTMPWVVPLRKVGQSD